MAEKKATSRKRSTTTKSSKSTRSTAKATTKRRTATKTAPVQYTPTVPMPAVLMPALAPPVPPEPAAPHAAPEPRAARSAPAGDQPSRFTRDHYLHATAPSAGDVKTPRPGKWLIFVSRSRVDALWETIRRAVERGRLGHAAKVSTALPEPSARDPKKHVIAVYTGDENDAVDVRRVRDALRGLGVTWRIPYKSDAAALAGQNDEMAGGPATKYYE
jgi:Domain of unknown function (DUF1917)